MFDSGNHIPTIFRAAAALAIALCALLSLPGCGNAKPANLAIPPAKAAPAPGSAAADATEPDPTLSDAERFAARVAGSGGGSAARPANREVQWTIPTRDPGTPGTPGAPGQSDASANPHIKTVSVAAPTPEDDTTTAEARAAAFKPAPAFKPARLTPQQVIERLSDDLKQAAADNESLRPYLARTALSLFDPQRELTEDDLKDLRPEDRRLVLSYQRAFTLLGRSLGHTLAEDRQNLQIAAAELADQLDNKPSTLHLKNVTLCTRVNGYGVYEPFASTTFLTGSEHPAIVYAELENFTPEIGSDGQYTVKLTQQVVLYNQSDGLAIWRIRPTEIVDRSRNRRRDFFVVQLITLPARLGVGKYNLKITLTDQVGQTVDEAELPIHLVADEKLLHQ